MTEILTKLFDTLKDEESLNITEISRRINSPHKTIKGYLEIIQFIQSQPRLIVNTTGSSYQISLEKTI